MEAPHRLDFSRLALLEQTRDDEVKGALKAAKIAAELRRERDHIDHQLSKSTSGGTRQMILKARRAPLMQRLADAEYEAETKAERADAAIVLFEECQKFARAFR